MKPRLSLLWLLLASLVPATGIAADRCSQGTGIGAAESRESPASPPSVPPPAGGIGGTGLISAPEGARAAFVGVITAFGSVCVNGDRVQYDAAVPTLFNGRPGDARDLHVGQVVRVEATMTDGALQATRIGVIDAVSGPVTRREEAMRRFWVMGQPVQLDDDTAIGLSGPTVPELGTPVRVSGLMTLDGGLVASRVERAAATDPVLITGRLTELDGRTAEVAVVPVTLPPSALLMPLAAGKEVAVSGRWTGERLEADAIVVEPRFAFAARPDLVSVQGYLHTCTDGSGIGLDGADLRLGAGVNAGAMRDAAVVVIGVPGADGVLTALRVTPSPQGATPVASSADPERADRVRTLTRCQPRLAPATTTP